MAGVPLKVPQISFEELGAFHDAHLSKAAIEKFASQFLLPPVRGDGSGSGEAVPQFDAEDHYAEEFEEVDGLGYYEDGVKRTLTDEQIAMFRHSEIIALRRAREKTKGKAGAEDKPADQEDPGRLSEGEASETGALLRKKKKRRRNNNKNKPQTEGQQMDLRKRTWDVVATGLDSLDYGDNEDTATQSANPAQRRRVSYDD